MSSRIESHLFLVAWLAHQLGFEDNSKMLSVLSQTHEEWVEGEHPVLQNILSRGCRYDRDKLIAYNQNILRHLGTINARRQEVIRLKYFQYLCALMTEICLDQIAYYKEEFQVRLNEFLRQDARFKRGSAQYRLPGDLDKLAVWGATGCGKTLLMHLNYYQYIYYVKQPNSTLTIPNNILLITPNEALSKQHIENMRESGIPYLHAHENPIGASEFSVHVIEITKFTEKQSNKGQGLNDRFFGHKNLLFVDEGHKGAGGVSWFETRARLAAAGFTFEYSATFGQALKVAGKQERDEEYFKHIVFDYSYYYFYNDGYGKDFDVLNLPENMRDDRRMLIFLGNLLSLCEQIHIYEDYKKLIQGYQLAPPLLLFLGSTVVASQERNITDIVFLVQFLKQVVMDRDGTNKPWVENALKKILSGEYLQDGMGRDVFYGKFDYIKRCCANQPRKIYAEILRLIFHVDGPADLEFYHLNLTKDELGLKVRGAEKYFGVINVGSVKTLITILEKTQTSTGVIENRQDRPLFENINDSRSSVNILLGARKFMEGWDSWRVSGMGLLNVGVSEGSSIIQLFGRGVRLRGKGHSLKRSKSDDIQAKPIKPLERLNIFGINAGYIQQFRKMLENEGMDKEEILLPVKKKEKFIKADLYIPRFPHEHAFRKEIIIPIEKQKDLQISIKISSPIMADSSDADTPKNQTLPWGNSLGDNALECLDMESLRLQLLEDKFELKRNNILINERTRLKSILKEGCSFVVQSDKELTPQKFADRDGLQENVYSALKKYINRLYRKKQKDWETIQMEYEKINDEHGNFFDEYHLSISKRAEDVIEEVERQMKNAQKIYEQEEGMPPRVYYEKHLYHPLLINNKEIDVSPHALEKSEEQFVRQLANYINQYPHSKREIFLLRNRTNSHGIGFYEDSGFFPDFILWIKKGKQQRILFVEPHGMMLSDEHHKRNIHQILKNISKELAKKKLEWHHLSMDCYILSVTPYKDLSSLGRYHNKSQQDLEKENILFIDDEQCIAKLLGDDVC